MALNLKEVELFLETSAAEALTVAGYPEVAAFIPVVDKFITLVESIAAQKQINWNPRAAVASAELGAVAELEALKDFP